MTDYQITIILFNLLISLVCLSIIISIFAKVYEAQIRCSITKKWCEITNPYLEWQLKNPNKTYKHPKAQKFIKIEIKFLKNQPKQFSLFDLDYINFLESHIIDNHQAQISG